MRKAVSVHASKLAAAIALATAGTASAASINVTPIGSFVKAPFAFNGLASEITAYSPVSKKFFVTNSNTSTVDVLAMDAANNITLASSLAVGGGPNSVAVHGNIVAVAVEANPKTNAGSVKFYDATTFALLNTLSVGAQPDMLTFSADGSKLLVANEGEPSDDYSIDPEGSVSIINMADGVANLNAGDVTAVTFGGLTVADIDSSTRIYGPGASIAQDLEPEYITVDPDSSKAYVTLQENNALLIIDLATAQILDVVGFGYKDHSLPGNGIDASDRDPNGAPVINITPRKVFGMYQPDAIASYQVDGQTYLLTANEGDARGWTGFNEEARVSTLDLDNTVFPDEAALKNNASLGRLTVTNKTGDTNGDGDFDALYVFGTRSFSIWNSSGAQVYDSGDDIEQTVAALDPTHFNFNHDDNSTLESRSDNKGPEPESATVAKIGGRTFAFIGLERQSSIMVFDVSVPEAPVFEQYISNRNFAVAANSGSAGDLGPEGVLYVPASQSPNGNHLLVVSNEVSGSTSFYNIDVSITGPNSTSSSYVVPSVDHVNMSSILTVGDMADNGYRMVGIPDGMGAFDNGNGTFTLLMNHELGNTQGIVRAHGAAGSFVSKWIINKSDLSVAAGSDLIQTVQLWNGAGYTANTYAINRLCSADLPQLSAFYNAQTGKGYNDHIFMNGEEAGTEGKGFAHLMDGTSYELPHLGNFSYENAVAHPATGDSTVVALTDDSGNGQVYVYVGSKTDTGLPVDKAGLTNGVLYGVKLTGIDVESDTTTAGSVGAFTLYSLGDVSGLTGAQLETASGSNVTKFQRPEDGQWDPAHPNDFYFLTTASFTGKSRLWKLHFSDPANPALGGTATMLLDGNEGPKMMDNMTIDKQGRILIQEDPGNQAHTAKIWSYDTSNDSVTEIAAHDPASFVVGGASYLGTQDEESSGVIDMSDILGNNWFLFNVQAHYNIAGELVQGGQLLAMQLFDRDTDGDSWRDAADNCAQYNPDQLDSDLDALANACDSDDDNDGTTDSADAFPLDAAESLDTDHDSIGNNADPDDDGDNVPDAVDLNPLDNSITAEVILPLGSLFKGSSIKEDSSTQ